MIITILSALVAVYLAGALATAYVVIKFGLPGAFKIAIAWPRGLPLLLKTWWMMRKFKR